MCPLLSYISIILAFSLPAAIQALNIIVSNDDGFAAANIREFYRLLKANGHNGDKLAVLSCAAAILKTMV